MARIKGALVDFSEVEIDHAFINLTEEDYILVALDGTVKFGISSRKSRSKVDGIIYIGPTVVDRFEPYMYGLMDTVWGFNYSTKYKAWASENWVVGDDLPKPQKPVAYITDCVTYVVMCDDEWSRNILTSMDTEEYARSVILAQQGVVEKQNEVSVSYINTGDKDLWMVSNGEISKLRAYHRSDPTESNKISNILRKHKMMDIYNRYKDTCEVVLAITTVVGDDGVITQDPICKPILFEKTDYDNDKPLRIDGDGDSDLIMVFYSREAADDFLKEVRNNMEYVVKMGEEMTDEYNESKFEEMRLENKKKMISVARISATMISTGVVFAATKLIFDYITKKKEGSAGFASRVITNAIIKRTAFGASMASFGALPSVAATGSSIFGIGTAASTIIPSAFALGPIAAGLGIIAGVIGTVIGVSHVTGSSFVNETLTEIPIVGTVVKGICKVADGIKWVGEKIWEGVKWVGGKIVEGAKWLWNNGGSIVSKIADKIGGFFSGIGSWIGGLFGF